MGILAIIMENYFLMAFFICTNVRFIGHMLFLFELKVFPSDIVVRIRFRLNKNNSQENETIVMNGIACLSKQQTENYAIV